MRSKPSRSHSVSQALSAARTKGLAGGIALPLALSFVVLSGSAAEAVVLCPSQPETECSVAGIGTLRLTTPRNPERRRLSIRWARGQELTKEDIGRPDIVTTYAICIYDEIANEPQLVFEANVPAGSDWDEPLRAPGYRYDDFLAESSGILFGRALPGSEDRSKIAFRGLGEQVPETTKSADPKTFLNVDGFVTGQILNDEGYCATLSFGQSDVTHNQKRRFRAAFD